MPLAISDLTVGPVYIAEWFDLGTRFAPAKIETNNIKKDEPVTNGKKAKGGKKPPKTPDMLTGDLRLRMFQPLNAPDYITLNLVDYVPPDKKEETPEQYTLLGPRKATYRLRNPTAKEAESALRVIAACEARAASATANPAAPKRGRAPKEPKAPKTPKTAAAGAPKAPRTKRAPLPDTNKVIQLKKGALDPYKGSRSQRFMLLKTGMTVGQYTAALVKAGFAEREARFILEDGTARGILKVQ